MILHCISVSHRISIECCMSLLRIWKWWKIICVDDYRVDILRSGDYKSLSSMLLYVSNHSHDTLIFFFKSLTTLLLSFAIQQRRWKRHCTLQTWSIDRSIYLLHNWEKPEALFTLYPVIIARQQDRNIQSSRCSIDLPYFFFFFQKLSLNSHRVPIYAGSNHLAFSSFKHKADYQFYVSDL